MHNEARPVTDFPLSPEILADEIGIPLNRWPGNCHGIAEAVLQMVPVQGMRLARGHFHGVVSRKSVYRGGGVQQHSWLVAEDGRILDPTRWAMDRPDTPYIYLGINDHYDEAGLELTARIPPQLPTGEADPREVMLAKRSLDEINRIARAIGSPQIKEVEIGSSGLRNLASALKYGLNRPPDHHDDPVELYAALEAAGLKSLIKMDLWNWVMAPERITRTGSANRWFTLPPQDKPTPARLFFDLCCRYISIEEREMQIEDELEELGYSLDEWHKALNKIEWLVSGSSGIGPGFEDIPTSYLDPLVVVSGCLLGQGFGTNYKVERYAASRGYPRRDLDRVLRAAGDRIGYDNAWI
jgi:hypothetical protein